MNDFDQVGLHCFVSGKVQGVWYRAFAKKQAMKLGLTGFAKNLPDERVEIKVYGAPDAIERFIKACQNGPPLARVAQIEYETIPFESCESFLVI